VTKDGEKGDKTNDDEIKDYRGKDIILSVANNLLLVFS